MHTPLLGTFCALLLLAGPATADPAAVGGLPVGDAPAALVAGHFPDRLHEFVWRNWEAAPAEKLARIVGAETADIVAMAESMGLPGAVEVPRAMLERGYVGLIRRNWHLLPYTQLLELLEMTPEVLDEKLREEDFLWVKLGRRKPDCAPLLYQAPDAAAQARAAEIRSLVRAEFGDALARPAAPRFEFVQDLSTPLPGYVAPGPGETAPGLRMVYSYVAVFGDPLAEPRLDPYPVGLLQRLSKMGINGVWLHAVLRDLAPGGETFPEFGMGHESRLENLRALVARAQAHGVQVYLYLNEPRAMPPAFFAERPELAGVSGGELQALCTSHPAVRQWMGDALAHVFREVPGLGGIYAITASENLTNCASHGGWSACPRCMSRTDTDILAEVVQVLEEGVHRSAPEADVIVSDWGWRGHGDARDIIAQLPANVWLMSVSEWALPITRGGVESAVGEYSISSVGPGPRALPHWEVARQTGLKTGAEIQFNNTCELASLPYLPVMDLVAEHCSKLAAAAPPDAMLIGWTMGGYPSPNLSLAARFAHLPTPGVEEVLEAVAQERFGPAGAPHARRAWTRFSEAFREYPFHISVVYTSPVQTGPANPLYWEPTGYSATMWGIPYDDVNGWRGAYPPEVLAEQFEKVAAGWQAGVAALEEAVQAVAPASSAEVASDLRFARAAGHHFASVANQIRFVLARDQYRDAAGSAETRQAAREVLQETLEAEIVLARELFALARMDSHLGFEPSCHYFYLPLDFVEKVINCRWLLEQVAP